ncbi:ABC transporter ATP-binding protein, partial [Acinetobacter baumannii]
GAGFIPDLTGYENIFFNGIMLGMTRREIEFELDTIIEFSELRKHIDAPVRNYSSGMVVRLGFAIAAHVHADIMFVDEALSVGDFDF